MWRVQRLTESCLNVLENLTTTAKKTHWHLQQPRRNITSAMNKNTACSQLQNSATGKLNYGAVMATLGRQPSKQFTRFYNEVPKFHEVIIRPKGTHLKSGAVRECPDKIISFGRFRAFLLVLAFIYCGGQASSLGARLLHDYEIFELPDDDDFE